MHPPRQAVASSPWRRAGSGEWLTQGEWGPGIRWGVSRTPSSRPQGDGRLPLARLQGCSGLARLHACVLLGTGSQPPPWCRVEPLQEDLERAPGSGQALRAAVTGTGQGRRAVSSLLVRLVSGAIKHARFSSPSESRLLLASGKLHWFSNQMRRPESWCWIPSAGAPNTWLGLPPRKDR